MGEERAHSGRNDCMNYLPFLVVNVLGGYIRASRAGCWSRRTGVTCPRRRRSAAVGAAGRTGCCTRRHTHHPHARS